MRERRMRRRDFLRGAAAGAGALTGLGPLARWASAQAPAAERPAYRGPNVILVRFGGGVRRRETLLPEGSHCPFLIKEFAKRGTLFARMEIAQLEGLETSHGQGTLNLLTGCYDRYKDVGGRFLGQRFEARVPTLFERLRSAYALADHEALLINGEDRPDEEFFTFSNHPEFGADVRGGALSLYRFKTFLLRRRLADWRGSEREERESRRKLAQLESIDRRLETSAPSPRLAAFWEKWRGYYGDSGLVNPRGDRLLTELGLWALAELKPRFLMINFNDCDFVHWGNPMFYTRGIAIMDEGLKRLVEGVERDEFYRGNTVFAVIPDCGRDDSRLAVVPFQHHFGDRSAHEIFALFVGPGIPAGGVVDRAAQQIDAMPTLARIMGLAAPHAQGEALSEAFA